MGLNTINGLPAHVLFVHFVVVLVPLAALLLVLCVAWPAAQRRLGFLTPLVAFATLVAVPLTARSGEWLEQHTGPDPLVRIHADLGDGMLVWSVSTFLLSAVWWAMHSERARSRIGRLDAVAANKIVVIVVAVVAVAVAAGSVVQVYRLGDSGAKAAWHDRVGEGSTSSR
jgi:hypothetical protein